MHQFFIYRSINTLSLLPLPIFSLQFSPRHAIDCKKVRKTFAHVCTHRITSRNECWHDVCFTLHVKNHIFFPLWQFSLVNALWERKPEDNDQTERLCKWWHSERISLCIFRSENILLGATHAHITCCQTLNDPNLAINVLIFLHL